MGQIIVTMQISLDGIVSHEDRWMTMSDEILEDYLAYYQSVDAIVVGGNTYADLAQYWQDAEISSGSALERDVAKRINDIPKIVLARHQRDLVWRNSRQILASDPDSLAREMDKLKGTTGNISVESGAATWQRFIQHDLYDRLWLFVHPAIASEGERLFALASHQQRLKLAGSKTYQNGVIGLEYLKV